MVKDGLSAGHTRRGGVKGRRERGGEGKKKKESGSKPLYCSVTERSTCNPILSGCHGKPFRPSALLLTVLASALKTDYEKHIADNSRINSVAPLSSAQMNKAVPSRSRIHLAFSSALSLT